MSGRRKDKVERREGREINEKRERKYKERKKENGKKEKRKKRGNLDFLQPQSKRQSCFAKRFLKQLQLHQRSRSTGGARAGAVFGGAGALPNRPLVFSRTHACANVSDDVHQKNQKAIYIFIVKNKIIISMQLKIICQFKIMISNLTND